MDDDNAVAAKLRYLATQINHLKEEVESNKLDSRQAVWRKPDQLDSLDFPRLDEEELRNLTCGSYQIKLATSYVEEHFNGGSDIMVHKDDSSLIRVKLQSRHVSAKSYLLWIRYDEGSITGWYCKCKAGARVVGVCAHIAAVIWYLAFGRHKECLPSVCNWGQFVEDATVFPDPVDESESDDDFVEE